MLTVDHSSDTMCMRRSHQSPSRERDHHARRRERGSDDKRRASRSHERHGRCSYSCDLTGTGTGNVKETGTEDTVIATMTNTAIAIGTETIRETVVDAGVKKTATMHQKIARKGNVARTARTSHLFLFLGTFHAGAREGSFLGSL